MPPRRSNYLKHDTESFRCHLYLHQIVKDQSDWINSIGAQIKSESSCLSSHQCQPNRSSRYQLGVAQISWAGRKFYRTIGRCQPTLHLILKKDHIKRAIQFGHSWLLSESRLPQSRGQLLDDSEEPGLASRDQVFLSSTSDRFSSMSQRLSLWWAEVYEPSDEAQDPFHSF